MDKYVKYIRKSQFDRDYAELSLEETLKRHEQILDQLAESRGYYIATTYKEVASAESIAGRPEMQKLLEDVSLGLYRGVLVVDLERLARGNGADQAYICTCGTATIEAPILNRWLQVYIFHSGNGLRHTKFKLMLHNINEILMLWNSA